MWACGPISRYAPNWLPIPISIPWIKSHHIPDILQSCNTLFLRQTPVEAGTAASTGVKKLDVFHNWNVYSTPQSAVFNITWMYSTPQSDVFNITFNSESEGFNFARWDAAGARWGMRKWAICNIYLVLREHLYFLQRENLYLEQIKVLGIDSIDSTIMF